MVRRFLAASTLLVCVLVGGSAMAGKDRPRVTIPEPSDGTMCVEVYFEDLSQTVCVPTP